ncbi:unnamed protein product, partial [Ectocarpus sp. 8 AP-2014]
GRRDGGGGGFEALKAHPFFRGLEFVGDGQPLPPSVTVPKLYELCVRALAHHMVDYADATPLVREPFPDHVDIKRLGAGGEGVPCGTSAGGSTPGEGAAAAAAANTAAAAALKRRRGFVERTR